MKRIALGFLLIVFIASPLFAAGITDSTKPLGHLKWAATAEDNYVFERDIDTPENKTKVEMEDINQIYGKLSLGLTPYFNVYAKVGASDAGDIKDYDTSDIQLDIDTEYGLLWGVGVSGAREIFKGNGWMLGLDAQFNWWRSDVDSVTFNGTKATNVGGKIVDLEFQGTPFVSKRFEVPSWNLAINPYVGLKVSYFRTQTDDNITYVGAGLDRVSSWTTRGDDYVGVVVGTDLEIKNNIALQVEGRFIDEAAITAGGTYRF